MANQTRSLPKRKHSSTALIGSTAFMAVSLAASILIAFQIRQPPVLGDTDAVTSGPTSSPTLTREVEPSVVPSPGLTSASPTLAETPLVSSGLTIGLAPLSDEAKDSYEVLQAAIERALATSSLSPPYSFVEVELIADSVKSSLELAGVSQVDIVLAWEPGPNPLTRFFVTGPSTPPLGVIDIPVVTWTLATPANLTLYADLSTDAPFLADILVAALEIDQGFIEAGQARVSTLHPATMPLPPAALSHNQAAVEFLKAHAEAQLGNSIRALQLYSRALRYQEEFAAAHLNRANLYLALGDPAAARRGYERAAALAGASEAPRYNEILTSWREGKLDEALGDALALATLEPEAAWAQNLVGLVYYAQGDYEYALSAFQQASKLDVMAQASLYNQGRTHHMLGQFDEALAAYVKLRELDPDNAAYFVHTALAYQAQREYRPARLAFARALELDPNYIDAYLLRGKLSLETHDYEMAVADATSILERDPQDGRAYEIIGDARLGQGDFVGAVNAYTKAINLNVRNPNIYASRGWSWHSRRYVLAAIQDYQQAIELGSTDALVLYRLGFALLDAGRYEDSLEALLAAINQGINTPEGYAILAVALDTNSRREEAVRSYQRALEMDARYGDPEFLAEQVMWTSPTIQRAKAILQQLAEE